MGKQDKLQSETAKKIGGEISGKRGHCEGPFYKKNAIPSPLELGGHKLSEGKPVEGGKISNVLRVNRVLKRIDQKNAIVVSDT